MTVHSIQMNRLFVRSFVTQLCFVRLIFCPSTIVLSAKPWANSTSLLRLAIPACERLCYAVERNLRTSLRLYFIFPTYKLPWNSSRRTIFLKKELQSKKWRCKSTRQCIWARQQVTTFCCFLWQRQTQNQSISRHRIKRNVSQCWRNIFSKQRQPWRKDRVTTSFAILLVMMGEERGGGV